MSDPYLETIKSMGRDVYDRMLDAMSIGHWPDGSTLSDAQREHCMHAVIAWGEMHLPPEERVGFIDKGRKARPEDMDAPQPLRWDGEGDDR